MRVAVRCAHDRFAVAYATASLETDEREFTRHLKAADPQRVVIMVQVENEFSTWGSLPDSSAAAQKLSRLIGG